MKWRTILIGIMMVLFLTGCKETEMQPVKNDIVKELTEQAFLLNDLEKEFVKELSKETVEDFIYQMKCDNYRLIVINEVYGNIAEGIIDDGNGKKLCCYKLPVTFSFKGDKELIDNFIDSFNKLNAKFVVNRFDITAEEDEYAVESIISFIGESTKGGIGGKANSLSLVKKSKEVKEEEEIVLRDFEVSLTVRPSNSDSAAVTLFTEAGNSLYSDENNAIDVVTSFYKEGNNYYCKYTVGDETQSDKIVTNEEIKFDILSCKKKIDEDNVSVNLTIENSTAKMINVVVYNDSDDRVKITKTGNVGVKHK